MKNSLATLAAITLVSIAVAPPPKGAAAASVEQFYKGKQVRMLIGYPPGGAYDLYGRMFARHINRYIPGQPTIVTQNMPGAGSAVLVQYLLKKAPKDGTVIGTISQYAPFQQIANDLTDKYNTRELVWIGNPDESNAVMPVMASTGVTTVEQAKKKEVILGSTASNGAGTLNALALNNIVGTKFKVIAGYAGTGPLHMAMERGEIDGRASDSMVGLKTSHPEWLKNKTVRILVQFGFERDPALQDVPLMLDLASNEAERKVFEMTSANAKIGRPIVTTPGVPADRLEALRKAFADTMKDPRFLEEAKKQALPIRPVYGEELTQAVDKVVNAPAEVVRLFKAAISTGKPFNCLEVAKDKSLCRKPRKKK